MHLQTVLWPVPRRVLHGPEVRDLGPCWVRVRFRREPATDRAVDAARHSSPRAEVPTEPLAAPSPSPSPKNGRSLAVHFSSRTHEWPTPDWLFELLDREFRFSLDPCSSDANARCARHFTRREDGLTQDWTRDVVFMNPPYGREIGQWMRKAFESAQAGATVVCLVPARTDTAWWHTYAICGEIRFLRGRLKFGEAAQGAPFPSAIVVFRPRHGGDPPNTRQPRGRNQSNTAGKLWCVMRCLPA